MFINSYNFRADLAVSITFERRLNCMKGDLMNQFKLAFPAMNGMARRLKDQKKTFCKMWSKDLKFSFSFLLLLIF